MEEHFDDGFNDKFNSDIKKSIDRIVPQTGKKEQMYENILAKAEKKKKNSNRYANVLKYSLPIAACLCVAVGCIAFGYGRGRGNTVPDNGYYGESNEEYAEGAVMGGNPFSDVDGATDFEELGIYIDAPDGAENVSYSIIDGEIADINFALRGHSYELRASQQSGDFTGLYGEEKSSEIIDAKSNACLYLIEDEFVSCYKVHWTDGSVNYYLVNLDGADEDEVRAVAAELIGGLN